MSKVLEFSATDVPAASDNGNYCTTVPYQCAAEAREDLCLTYGPEERLDLGPASTHATRVRSLYGVTGTKNRTWPAYGSFGGGWETLLPRDVKPTPSATVKTCGGITSDLDYSGYQSGPFNEFRGLSADFIEWARRGGHRNKSPWKKGLEILAESPPFEAPERVPTPGPETDPHEPGEPADRAWEAPGDLDKALALDAPRIPTTLRADGDDSAALAWDEGKGWRWSVSAARWRRPHDSGISFWGYAWYDTPWARYVVGPVRPVDQVPNLAPARANGASKTWYRLTSLVRELRRIMDSPAPGIREIPLHR